MSPLDRSVFREMVANTVAQQRAKLDTYWALKDRGLPVPLDLKTEIEANNLHDPSDDD